MTERATQPRDAAADDLERDRAATPGDVTDRDETTQVRRAAPSAGGTIAREERLRGGGPESGRGNATAGEADLFDPATAADLQRRWQDVQVRFVDEPRESVERADKLVAEVLDQLTSSFASERRDLEAAWSGGREASTEDLRQAIRRYRSFFNRLLAV